MSRMHCKNAWQKYLLTMHARTGKLWDATHLATVKWHNHLFRLIYTCKVMTCSAAKVRLKAR